LYLAIAVVSTIHAVSFFALSNMIILAIVLAVAFEIGQASVLFNLLINTGRNKKNALSWILMGVLTIVQILGNVFSSYRYMITNNADQIDYFTKSVLFFVQSPNPEMNYVMISYITGAILPVVALCMTAIVVRLLNQDSDEDSTKQPGRWKLIKPINNENPKTPENIEEINENSKTPENIEETGNDSKTPENIEEINENSKNVKEMPKRVII
jgi:hypothetical protein